MYLNWSGIKNTFIFMIMSKIVYICCLILLIGIMACSKDSLNSYKDNDDVCTTMDDIKFMKWCYDNYDVNGDGRVSTSEAAAVRVFETIFSDNYSSVKGLEYFTGVETLRINGTFTEIDISHMPNLKEIQTNSHVSFYDFRKNAKLKTLVISNTNKSINYSLEKPSLTIIGFEKLYNPFAVFTGIVKMDEVYLNYPKLVDKEQHIFDTPVVGFDTLITNKLITSQDYFYNYLDYDPINGDYWKINDITISGETYHNIEKYGLYWKTIVFNE